MRTSLSGASASRRDVSMPSDGVVVALGALRVLSKPHPSSDAETRTLLQITTRSFRLPAKSVEVHSRYTEIGWAQPRSFTITFKPNVTAGEIRPRKATSRNGH